MPTLRGEIHCGVMNPSICSSQRHLIIRREGFGSDGKSCGPALCRATAVVPFTRGSTPHRGDSVPVGYHP